MKAVETQHIFEDLGTDVVPTQQKKLTLEANMIIVKSEIVLWDFKL